MMTSKKTFLLLAISLLALSFFNCTAFAKQVPTEATPSVTESAPTVVAPGGLAGKERAALQRQYQYEIRKKEILVSPYFDTSAVGPGAEKSSDQKKAEESLLYQRFNAAVGLYKSGKYDEAADILRYILEKDPENEYVRSYLERVEQKTQPKKHYATETRVPSPAQNWAKNSGGVGNKRVATVKKSIAVTTQKNTKEQYVLDPLKQAELEQRVAEILNIKKLEEIKSEHFILGPGDTVQIDVSGHPELTGMANIRVDGELVLPYVHDSVMAEGLIVEELDEKITTALEKYIQDPQVDVSVISYKSRLFYVIDEDSCTPYPITRANMTLRDALFISDWGSSRALGRVLIIKPSKNNALVKKVDAFNLIYRGDLKDNVRISDGDVIYVPMTVVSKVTKTIFDTMAPFSAIRNARDEYLNLKWNQQDWKSIGRLPPTYEQEAEDAKNLDRNDNMFVFYGDYNR